MGRRKAPPRRRVQAQSHQHIPHQRGECVEEDTTTAALGVQLSHALFSGGFREEQEHEEHENNQSISTEPPPPKRARSTGGGGYFSRAARLPSLSLVPVTIKLSGNEGRRALHPANQPESEKAPHHDPVAFELARVEAEVDLGNTAAPLPNSDSEAEPEGRGDGDGDAGGGSRYKLRLSLKPNSSYKRKKVTQNDNRDNTTLLQCCLVDQVEGKQGACTVQSLSGTYNEVETVILAFHEKWLCLDKTAITDCDSGTASASMSSTGKRKNKKNRKRKVMVTFSVCLSRKAIALSQPSAAYEKPGRSVEQRVRLLLSCLTFIRPDFFFTDLPASDLKATEDSLREEARIVSKDHLEMAMHTVGQGSDQINTALLYAAIAPEKKKGKEEEECCGDDDDMGKYLGNIPGLVPKLRAYQTRAVKWMLEREESLGQYEGECPLWKQVSDISSAPRRTMHINVCTGQVSPHAFPKNTKVPGGILADEMGLGKTVELLACILANRCPLEVKQEEEKESETSCEEKDEEQEEPLKMFSGGGYDSSYSGTWVFCEDCKSWLKLEETGYGKQESLPDQYICGHCVRERAKDASLLQKQCKTTLIICPDPILEQWQEELAKHTYHGYLKVFTYLGQKASLSTGGSPDDIITAKTLSEYDVVLSTYGVLSADLHKDSSISDTFEENQKSLRHAKRYQKVPTPLTRLAWWRVCLDEAQMVHNRTAKSAEMALKLSTRYRWCVTGTPINKGLEDLYGLMVFLQLHPYDYKYWWNKLVQAPCDEGTTRGFSNLTKLLQPSSGGIMWRTRKHDVKDDLNLQPQMVKITKLRLSPVERHFYKKQHQECYAVAKAALPQHLLLDTSTGGDGEEERTLKPREAGKIFVKLLRLRQACCHPQVGSQGIRSLSQTSKPLTMDEILDMLIVKAKTDAEDILRIVIFCLNGLASVFQLENNKQDAVKAYREALQYSSTHMKAGVKTDTLQQLHTLHNLSLLLKESIPGIAPTLRDSLLESEAKDLKKEYLKNASSGLIIANSDFVTKKSKVLVSNHDDRVGQNWWIEVLFAIENSYDSASHFVDQIKSRLNDRTAAGTSVHGRNSTSFVHRFSDIGGLKYLLSSELLTMFDSRDEAMAELLKLEEECQRESPDFIYEASHCGRCRGELGTGLVRCAFCKLDDLLMRYEARIFSLRTQATNTRAVLNADDATRAQESASGFAGGWGRMAGRSVESKKGKSHHAADDLGRGARNRADKGVTHADVFHAPSETEIVLDFIASIASRGKYRSVNLSLRADFDTIVKTHMALLENMRSEFKPARAYAQAQRQYIYSFDELEMAMMRMQLRAEGEELFHEHEKYFKLYESELVVRNKELSDEKIVAHSDLTRAVGTLRYLEGLRAARRRSKSGGGAGGEATEEEETVCPVCQEHLSEDMAVLSCGHVFCSKCVMALIARSGSGGDGRAKRSGRKKILCPNCRNSIHVSEIAYADDSILKEHDEHEEKANNHREPGAQLLPNGNSEVNNASDPQLDFDLEDIRIKGSYGSKLEAVARRVLSILSKDAAAKILVFSEWQDVLELLAHALSANQVPFVYVKGKPQMSKALKQFKLKASCNSQGAVSGDGHTHPLGASVLMLPVKLGANGLNLIEAQHVILIEPLLDPAKEAQAFGRVDRIGQTKKTFVHRFIVSGTVEEKVYQLAQQRASMYSIMGVPASRAAGSSRSKKFSEEQSLTIKDIKELLVDSSS